VARHLVKEAEVVDARTGVVEAGLLHGVLDEEVHLGTEGVVLRVAGVDLGHHLASVNNGQVLDHLDNLIKTFISLFE